VEIILENTGKKFSGGWIFKNISQTFSSGDIVAVTGPNGSGKTTLLGIVMDVLRANKGEFLWFGQPGGSPSQRKKIGSLLETPNFYSYLSGTDNLKITQAISGRGSKKEIDEVLKKVNLYDRRWSAFKSYSLGMKQRLAIGAALLGDPKVLVLDEPTNGLDPQGIADVRNLIIHLSKEKKKTLFISSHLLNEMELIADSMLIINKGKKVAERNKKKLLKG